HVPAPTATYTLSLHDALPISAHGRVDARHSGVLVPGDRRRPPAARGHGQVAHQSRPDGACAPGPQAARRRIQSGREQYRQAHGSVLMNVTTEQLGGVSVVRVGETRLMYPILGDFSAAVANLISAGKRDILTDLSPVTYV